MKCPACGAKNQEEAKFCMECGQRLVGSESDESLVDTLSMKKIRDEDLEDYGYEDQVDYEAYEDFGQGGPDEGPKKRPKWPGILAILFLGAVLAVGGYFAYQYYQRTQEESKAQAYLDQENFQGALAIYEGLYKETGDQAYKKDMDQVQVLQGQAGSLHEVDQILEDQDTDRYEEAYKALLAVKQSGTRYSDRAQETLASLTKDVEKRGQDLIDRGRYTQALNLVNPLLEADPENETLGAVKEKAQAERAAYQERVRREEEEKRRQEEELEKKKQEAQEAAKRAIEEAFGSLTSSGSGDDD